MALGLDSLVGTAHAQGARSAAGVKVFLAATSLDAAYGGPAFSVAGLARALTQAGVSREDAYRMVQRNAMAVWQSPPPRPATALLDKLKADAEVTGELDAKTLAGCFDDAHHFTRVDAIFARVFA